MVNNSLTRLNSLSDVAGESFLGAEELSHFMYVDETSLVTGADHVSATRHVTTGPTIKVVRPIHLERKTEAIVMQTEAIGMWVNCKKTNLLCIGTNNGCDTSARILIGGQWIESSNSFKLVGFNFGRTPDVSTHIASIKEAYRKMVWMLYHLRLAGMKGRKLCQIYCAFVRSVIKYCSALYHSMLSRGEAKALERLHRHVLRVCWGTAEEIRDVMLREGLESLEMWRNRRVDSFIKKSWEMPGLRNKWFPLAPCNGHDLRRPRRVSKVRAKTTRRFKSSLLSMKRRANEIELH